MSSAPLLLPALLLASVLLPAVATDLKCQDLGILKSKSASHPNVCGITALRHCKVPEEHEGGTWDTVQNMCVAIGARMCTIEELQNGCASGTGGGYDDEMVWSSTPCEGGGGHLAFQWLSKPMNVEVAITGTTRKVCPRTTNQNKHICLLKKTECLQSTALAFPRCCADHDCSTADDEDACSAKRCANPTLDFRQFDTDPPDPPNAYFQYTCGGLDDFKQQDGETTNNSTCGITRFSDCTGKCDSSSSFQTAEDACEKADLRMCTEDELRSGVGSNQANPSAPADCKFDDAFVWSSSTCDTDPGQGVVVNFDTGSSMCADQSDGHGMRCCAEFRPTNAPSAAPTQVPTTKAPTVPDIHVPPAPPDLKAICACGASPACASACEPAKPCNDGGPLLPNCLGYADCAFLRDKVGVTLTPCPTASPTISPSPRIGKTTQPPSAPTAPTISPDGDDGGGTAAAVVTITFVVLGLVGVLFVWRRAQQHDPPLTLREACAQAAAPCLPCLPCLGGGRRDARGAAPGAAVVQMATMTPNPVHPANASDPDTWKQFTAVGGEKWTDLKRHTSNLQESNKQLQREVARLKKDKQQGEMLRSPQTKPKKKRKSTSVREWQATLAITPPGGGGGGGGGASAISVAAAQEAAAEEGVEEEEGADEGNDDGISEADESGGGRADDDDGGDGGGGDGNGDPWPGVSSMVAT